jgi:hypothetical protein
MHKSCSGKGYADIAFALDKNLIITTNDDDLLNLANNIGYLLGSSTSHR